MTTATAVVTTNHNHSGTNSTNHQITTTVMGMGSAARETVDIVARPETPPADYDTAFNEMHISSNANNSKQQQQQQQQCATDVIY